MASKILPRVIDYVQSGHITALLFPLLNIFDGSEHETTRLLSGDAFFNLFELVKGRIERALTHLESFSGHLSDALRDRPAVHGLKRDCLQNQQVERALYKICRFTQGNSHQ
jgi:hypothetical protein